MTINHPLTMCFQHHPRISTPRRFGKTISVCLFVAALIFACPNVEISIYSTCKQSSDFTVLSCVVDTSPNIYGLLTGKRISQKLLRNCVKFLSIIHEVLNIPHLEFLKQSMDEVELRGGESKYDTRRLNSYPSKVALCSSYLVCFQRLNLLFRICKSPVSNFRDLELL